MGAAVTLLEGMCVSVIVLMTGVSMGVGEYSSSCATTVVSTGMMMPGVMAH